MYMIATNSMQNSGQISTLENVLEFIKKKAIAKTTQKVHEPKNIEGSLMMATIIMVILKKKPKKWKCLFAVSR